VSTKLGWHAHEKVLSEREVHVPLFWHGLDEQGLIVQRGPKKPD